MITRFRTQRSAITFDLGAAGIRAFQFQRRGRRGDPRLCDGLQLDWTAAAPSDPPAPPPFDPAQIHRLIGQGRFEGREVTLVVSPPDVQFFPMRLPDQALTQPPERVEQALKWEVARESRTAADSLEVRYWRLPPAAGPHANVMAVVLPTPAALDWCGRLQGQHLALRRIDVSPCALVHLAAALWTPAESDLWGVLDLGLRHSTLTVVVGRVPTYIRSLSVSAHHWTQQLAAAFQVPYPVAEQLKRENGVEPIRPGARGLRSGAGQRAALRAADLTSAFSGVLRESLSTLVQEIGRCFAYVMQGLPEGAVRGLYLAGGGSTLRGLPALLTAELEIPVTTLSASADDRTTAAAPLGPGTRIEPRGAAALGGALLDLEAS